MSDRTAQITLRALVTARWVLLALLAVAGAIVAIDPRSLAVSGWLPQHPGAPTFVILWVSWAGINLATSWLIVVPGRASPQVAGVHLLVDATYLTVLLALSGGATNAFTTVYFVPITLATQVSPRWTWALAGYCLAGFAALFLLHPIPKGPSGHEMHFAGHLRGMWVAFGVSGALITYFVHRIALSLSRQRVELTRLREQALEGRHLGALGTLAAGAAHELGTPLGSIELLVAELEAMPADERRAAITTVREQVARCKTILQRMASPELRVVALGEGGGPAWRLQELADDLRLSPSSRVTVVDETSGAETRLPRDVLGQIVRELVANGLDASGGAATITVRIGVRDDHAVLAVRDDGPGMSPETRARAFDPFFSTKAEGQGMGLGLYLARAQVRQLGGTLSLQSEPAEGTTVELTIPLRPPAPRTLP